MQSSKGGAARKVAFLGVFGAAAIVLSILENILSGMLNFAIPGVKVGIANTAVVLALYYLGARGCFVVALLKAAAAFLATGAVTVLWFSLAGSALSAVGMWLLWRGGRGPFTLAGVSALGGFLSNLAQICVMIALSETMEFLYYFPVIGISGAVFGFLMGMLCNVVAHRIGKEIPKGK